MNAMPQAPHLPQAGLPPPPRPGSSYEQPFELLEACHQRVERSLDLLLRLVTHLEARGGRADAMARETAADVRRYFNVAAPLHHQDEELHLFPALEARGGVSAALCAGLRAQHREMEALWALLDAALAVLDDPARLRRLAEAFVALQRAHLATEEAQVFPAAGPLLSAAAQQAMGIEMAARRGLDLGSSEHQ